MRVTGEDDGVVDVVVVEMFEDAVAIGTVSVPCILRAGFRGKVLTRLHTLLNTHHVD